MSQTLIVLPLAAQAFVTFAVLLILGRARRESLRRRNQSVQDIALAENEDWDEWAQQCANNFRNQFELPVLFYAVGILALITRSVDVAFMVLACLFVLTRVAHAAIHVTDNVVKWRATAYLIGFVILVAMWVVLLWRVVAPGV